MSLAFSIRIKITLCFLLLVILMSSVFALISYFRIIDAMDNEIHKHGIGTVKILSKMAAPYIFESDYATIMDLADKLIHDREIQNFTIIDANGKTWLSTHPKQETIATDDPFYSSLAKNKAEGFRRISRDGINMMEFANPITALGKVQYLLKIEVSLERIEQQASQRIRENLIIGATMMALAAWIAVFLARLLTTPLKVLVQGTRELSRGNLSHRINVNSTDETGLLSESFNSMAENLEKELSVRREAERKLQEHSENLERTVAERTTLLTETNEKLSEEIEERKKAEVALLESRERYKRFSEVTLDGIIFHNEEGIIDANASFTEMFGFPLETVKGKNLIETICLTKHRDAVRDKLASDPDKCVETIGRRENGQTVPIEMQNRILMHNTKTLTVTSIRDTTERKQLEAQLEQAQRMEGVGRLAAGIAHDLNNILSGIITLPQFLLLDLPKDSQLRDSLLSIQQSGESAAVIVQDMMTLAGSSLTMEKVLDPISLIKSYIVSPESMKLKQTHPGIVIKLDFGEGVSNIKGSAVHLTQALMNLVKNGADAIEGEGEIVISVKHVHIDTPSGNYETISHGDYVCLSVTDSGTGIPDEKIPFVFEPFYTKKVLGRSGTGLGMVIVWNTVKDHNGYIDITSNVGIGTEVSMYIPVTEDEIQESKYAPGLQCLKGDMEFILVVDDIAEQRKIASHILERLNYKVRSVSGGVEAVEFLKKQPADLILLDMIMAPGINGLETSKRIFSLYPDATIIIASGYAESDMVRQALELGVTQYIKKPYSINTLGAVVRDNLNKT